MAITFMTNEDRTELDNELSQLRQDTTNPLEGYYAATLPQDVYEAIINGRPVMIECIFPDGKNITFISFSASERIDGSGALIRSDVTIDSKIYSLIGDLNGALWETSIQTLASDEQLESVSVTANEAKEAAEIAQQNIDTIVTFGEKINLYDITLTEDNLTGKFYVSGNPYTVSTTYDNTYNATEKIYLREFAPDDTVLSLDVKRGKVYSFRMVPTYTFGVMTLEGPWPTRLAATNKIMFYDEADNFIGNGSLTDEVVVTIPENAVYFRIQIYRVQTFPYALNIINQYLMITEGSDIWTDYYGPTVINRSVLNDDIHVAGARQVFYNIDDSQTIKVISHYNNDHDLRVTLKEKGPNSIFDFASFDLMPAMIGKQVTSDITSDGIALTAWGSAAHGPFQIKAVNNADGDNFSDDGETYNSYFTGGNHGYDNTGTIEGNTATGRTDNIRLYADGKQIKVGSGYARSIRICWENYIQAQNTTKADGTGREVLKEVHEMIFDGVRWNETVYLIPLEEIKISLWYALQGMGIGESKTYNESVIYSGGIEESANRSINAVTDSSNSGSVTANKVIARGSEHEMVIEIDRTCDLGSRWMSNSTYSCFFNTSKFYFNIINGNTRVMSPSTQYELKGSYRFKPV